MPSSPASSPPSSRPSARDDPPFSFPSSVCAPRRAECARAAFCRAFLRSPDVVAAQGRQMRHNSRVVHSTIFNSPKSAQILVGLTACSYSLGKSRFTTSRSRLISICNGKKRIQNPSRTIRGVDLRRVLIIISYHLKHIEKEEMDYRLHTLIGSGISLHTPTPWPWLRLHRLL
jgi:hypothetical protein